ncbi:hypothetical protein [Rhizosphaericola mali]|jgi:hypothetical protein|uniref:Uncharacterized protein n=1 Tax=Rhizosphaericola mali TaxID=2545455 RepID=A0A5P2G5V0_9BACT|nr:hypothetical protein [Rhizosphaericola mali]QES89559.1 hypothetical protein E0W69_013105 [Rhizosphaericola mali]
MYSYSLLEPDCYYIVQLVEDAPLTLIQVKVVSDYAMYVVRYENEMSMQWVKKTDKIFDIVELLSDEAAQKWLNVYTNNEESFYGGSSDEL